MLKTERMDNPERFTFIRTSRFDDEIDLNTMRKNQMLMQRMMKGQSEAEIQNQMNASEIK